MERWKYDAMGRVERAEGPDGVASETSYDFAGRPTEQRLDDGSSTTVLGTIHYSSGNASTLAQQVITDGVPEAVVDVLEPVHVEEHQRDEATVASAAWARPTSDPEPEGFSAAGSSRVRTRVSSSSRASSVTIFSFS